MSDLIDTTEMYLRTIYELIEDGVVPMRARIAEQLEHSGPTVSQTVARMERDGLVVLGGDRQLELTELGKERAVRVMRKHRLAERLLTDIIGLDLPDVHEEACRWEHVMSERVERRVIEMIDGPLVSPYGNPIPGLAELGVGDQVELPDGVSPLEFLANSDGVDVTIVRWGEMPQTIPGLLEDAVQNGLLPGATVHVTVVDGDYLLQTARGDVVVGPDVARHIFGTQAS